MFIYLVLPAVTVGHVILCVTCGAKALREIKLRPCDLVGKKVLAVEAGQIQM